MLTDLETRFEPGCLEALVARCATKGWLCHGRNPLALRRGDADRTPRGVVLALRAGRSSLGKPRRLAVRRNWSSPCRPSIPASPVPAHASLDQMLPLIARENAQLVIVAPDASERIGARRRCASSWTVRMRIRDPGHRGEPADGAPRWRRGVAPVRRWRSGRTRSFAGDSAFRVVAALSGLYLALTRNQAIYLFPLILSVVVVALALAEVAASACRPVNPGGELRSHGCRRELVVLIRLGERDLPTPDRGVGAGASASPVGGRCGSLPGRLINLPGWARDRSL